MSVSQVKMQYTHALLPKDLGAHVCSFLHIPFFMCIVPRVCKTWNGYLGRLINNYFKEHLNLSAFSWDNNAKQTSTDRIKSCLSYISKRLSIKNMHAITLNLPGKIKLKSYFPNLTEVNTTNTYIRKIEALKGLPLKILHMTACQVRDRDLTIIEDMPLVSLKLIGCLMTRFPQINANHLRALDISYTSRLALTCLTEIAQFPLSSLKLEGCHWITHVKGLRDNTTLLSLNLSRTLIHNPALNDLPKTLTNLDLNHCCMITRVGALVTLTQLCTLNLTEVDATDISLLKKNSLTIIQNKKRLYYTTFIPPEKRPLA